MQKHFGQLDGQTASGSGCKYDAIFTSIAASHRLIISNWTFSKSSGFMQHVYLVKSPYKAFGKWRKNLESNLVSYLQTQSDQLGLLLHPISHFSLPRC